MRHIVGDIRNKILRILDNTCYYFDDNGIYRGVPYREAKKMYDLYLYNSSIPYASLDYRDYDKGILRSKIHYNYPELNGNTGNLLIKVINILKPGDTIDDFDEYLDTIVLEKRLKPSGIERFVTKIDEPVFTCASGNTSKNTFDFVYVYVNIISQWDEDKLTYIRKHQKEIFKMVQDKIASSRKFQKFGIPINFLKATNAVLRRDNVLEILLELKI